MFKIQPKPTFLAKVQISIPGQDKPAQIEAEFKHLGTEGLKAFFTSIDGKTNQEVLSEIVVGWKGVDAEFSDEALATLLDNYPTAARGFIEAFQREAMEAKPKN